MFAWNHCVASITPLPTAQSIGSRRLHSKRYKKVTNKLKMPPPRKYYSSTKIELQSLRAKTPHRNKLRPVLLVFFRPSMNQPARIILQWLAINGDAIYGTHNWTTFAEGGRRGGVNIRFTVKGDYLYAIILGDWPGNSVTIKSLSTDSAVEGKITSVTMLGAPANCRSPRTMTA
jgi:hypothetical protein